jgi:ABC-2 type transport system permease protein
MRREIWEHRSLWIAPLLVAVLLIGALATAGRIQLYEGAADPARVNTTFQLMLLGWDVPFLLTAGLVVVVYLLDCLYGERRDRSILFWRSMPVSDTQAVLAKLLVAMVAVPLGTYLLAAVTSVLASGILELRHTVLLNDRPVPAWNGIDWLRMQLLMLGGLSALVLSYMPYAAYLMLASAWSRRSPYAWAFLPPVLAAILENLLFGTNYLGKVVERGLDQVLRLGFNLNLQFAYDVGDRLPRPRPPTPGQGGSVTALLTSPQMFIGLAAAALMLLLVIRLRRYRDDS